MLFVVYRKQVESMSFPAFWFHHDDMEQGLLCYLNELTMNQLGNGIHRRRSRPPISLVFTRSSLPSRAFPSTSSE